MVQLTMNISLLVLQGRFVRVSQLRGMAVGLLCACVCCQPVQAQSELPESIRSSTTSFLDKIGQGREISNFELNRIGCWKIVTVSGDSIVVDANTGSITSFINGSGKPIYELRDDQAAKTFASEWLTRGGLSPEIDLVVNRVNDNTWNLISDEPIVNGLPSGGLRKLVLTVDQSTGVVAMFRQPPYAFPSPTPGITSLQAVEFAESRSESVLGKRAKAVKGPTLSYASPAIATDEWTTPGFLPKPDSRNAVLVYLLMLEGDISVTIDAETGQVWNGGTSRGLSREGSVIGDDVSGSSRANKDNPEEQGSELPYGLVFGATFVVVIAGWLGMRKR